jgi:hypothetical protein
MKVWACTLFCSRAQHSLHKMMVCFGTMVLHRTLCHYFHKYIYISGFSYLPTFFHGKFIRWEKTFLLILICKVRLCASLSFGLVLSILDFLQSSHIISCCCSCWSTTVQLCSLRWRKIKILDIKSQYFIIYKTLRRKKNQNSASFWTYILKYEGFEC